MENLEEYEASFLTEKDIEQIINSLSDDIIFDSLVEQIENVFNSTDSSPVFYLTYFTGKYNFLMNKYAEYEDLCNKIKEIREEFFFKLKGLIETKFDFVVEFDSALGKEEQFLNISHMYNFFIIRFKDNSANLVNKYIDREMKDLIKYYKPLIDKKDLTYANMKKTINKDATVVICKLPEIIQNMTVDSPKDVVGLLIDDEYEISNMMIKDIFVASEWISYGETFIDNIMKSIKQNEVYYLLTRTSLVNKYNMKK
jgi:hypothetical protein